MSSIRLYIDEDSMDQVFVRALRSRDVDVITVRELRGRQAPQKPDIKRV